MLLLSLTASAAYRSSQSAVSHHLTLSLGGGAALPGAKGELSLGYELSTKIFYAGIQAGADVEYGVTRLSPFTETFDRTTRDGDPIRYSYCYASFREKDAIYSVMLPIYFGFHLGRYAYVQAGAAVMLPFMAQYTSVASMYTSATFNKLPEDIVGGLPSYGYGLYPESEYTYSARPNILLNRLAVLPSLEAGVRLPLKGKLDCRVGAFVQYRADVLLQQSEPKQLVDLSKVDLSPTSQSQQNLQQNIVFHSLLTEVKDYQPSPLTHLFIGLRFTLRLNVGHEHHKCMCNDN